MRVKQYSSDLRDRDWQRLVPLLVVRRTSKWPLLDVVNAILYVLKNGCVWRDIPGDFPPWQTVYYYFAKWEKDGTWEQVNSCLVADCRELEKNKLQPSAVIIDTQSVKNTATSTQAVGFDGGKRIKGRKRLFVVDTHGRLLASTVVSAAQHDGTLAIAFWDAWLAQHPLFEQVEVVYVDGSFTGKFKQHLAKKYGIRVEKPAQVVRQKGAFCLHAKRWVVERSIAWTNFNRRLSKDYERKTTRANAFILLANIRRAVRHC